MNFQPELWKAKYERDGYLVVEDVLDLDLLGQFRRAIECITADPDSLPERLKRYCRFERDFVKWRPQDNSLSREELGNALNNVMELPLFDPIFAELICHAPLLDILEVLFESTEFAFHNYKAVIKAARVSSKFRWHRDLPYLEHTTPNLITAMLCLDDMTAKNGATVVFPGTHTIPHEQVSASDVAIAEENLPARERVTVCCRAGAAVLFHVSIIHGGGPNRSEHPRRNLISIWSGPGAYPLTSFRSAYYGLMPRSRDEARRSQIEMTFPKLFGGSQKKVLDVLADDNALPGLRTNLG